MSATPPGINKPSPGLGEDNKRVLCGLLGLTPAELEELERQGVIGYVPAPSQRKGKPEVLSLEEQKQLLKLIRDYDPEYRQRLGIAGPADEGRRRSNVQGSTSV